MEKEFVSIQHTMLPKNSTASKDQGTFDQVTGSDGATIFMIGEALSLLCAVFYYKFLPAGSTNVVVRHVVSILMGISIGFFCFGSEYLVVIVQAVLCYGAILILPHNLLQTGILVFSLLYLNLQLLYRQLVIDDVRIYRVDVSGTLMVATEKVTSLAFGLADGRKTGPMSDLRKRLILKKIPSPMEYFSYMLCFQGLMAGPLFFYTDYIAYIQGTNREETEATDEKHRNEKRNEEQRIPSPYKAVMHKLMIALFWIFLHIGFQAFLPKERNAGPGRGLGLLGTVLVSFLHNIFYPIKEPYGNCNADFIRTHSIQYRIIYMFISFIGFKAKFYLAFILGDAICNAAGLGFTGYGVDGQPKWDLVTNVRPLAVEFGLSPKTVVENWNIQTTVWMRQICYDRVTTYNKQKTFLLSAMWHGCFPGYWLSFIPCGFFVGTFNLARKKIRPYFLGSRPVKLFYDVMTWFLTQVVIAYLMMPFCLLNLKPSIDFFMGMYWSIHIICVFLTFTLPLLPTPAPDKQGHFVKNHSPTTTTTTTTTDDRGQNGISPASSKKEL